MVRFKGISKQKKPRTSHLWF